MRAVRDRFDVPGRRLQRLGRVRDGQGRGRGRAPRRADGRARVADRDPPGGRRDRDHLLGEGARRAGIRASEPVRALVPRAEADPGRRQLARSGRCASVGVDEPFFVARGEGAYIETADGRRLADWVQSWGPLIFGHADPETVEAVREAALDGTSFGAPTEREVELAAEIADAVPSIEQVRLVSSGTEAAMSALRLARAVHAPRRGAQVRRRLPRPRRRVPRRGRLGPRDARHTGLAGRPERGRRRDGRRRLQRRRPRSRRGRAAQRGSRGDLRRARRGEHGLHPAGAGVPRGAAHALRRLGRAARLRRGDHGLPRRARRRPGALRRACPT